MLDNNGLERVWLSRDAGSSWQDVTANLRAATGVIGRVRPSALLLLPLAGQHQGTTALLVGTANGVYVSHVSSAGAKTSAGANASSWSRLGDCSDLPLVMVAGLSYQPIDDTLVAATMGRGVYVVHEATAAVAAVVS